MPDDESLDCRLFGAAATVKASALIETAAAEASGGQLLLGEPVSLRGKANSSGTGKKRKSRLGCFQVRSLMREQRLQPTATDCTAT